MKKLFTVLLLSATPLLAAHANDTKTYNLALSYPGKPVEIDVEVYRGSITVEGYKGDTIEITANFSEISKVDKDEDDRDERRYSRSNNKKKTTSRSTQGLKKLSNNIPHLQIEEDENEVEISSESQKKNVHLTIRVPRRASMKMELYRGGDVVVSNMDGILEIENYKGGIKASNITGPIVAETYQQDIEVDFGQLSQKDPSFLTSHAGNIDVTMGSKLKSRVEVQTYKGEIYSGLDTPFTPSTSINKSKDNRKQEIILGGVMAAELNGGGQKLTLNTYSGNLYIRKGK